MSRLSGVRYTVELPRTKRVKGCTISVERVIANGRFVGTVEQRKCKGRSQTFTCTKKKVCRKGTYPDLIWLFESAGLRTGERRR